jgi:hypothetical protein
VIAQSYDSARQFSLSIESPTNLTLAKADQKGSRKPDKFEAEIQYAIKSQLALK